MGLRSDSEARGLTSRDIAKLLGIPHSSVQNIERRALEKMRKAAEKQGVKREDVLEALTALGLP